MGYLARAFPLKSNSVGNPSMNGPRKVWSCGDLISTPRSNQTSRAAGTLSTTRLESPQEQGARMECARRIGGNRGLTPCSSIGNSKHGPASSRARRHIHSPAKRRSGPLTTPARPASAPKPPQHCPVSGPARSPSPAAGPLKPPARTPLVLFPCPAVPACAAARGPAASGAPGCAR
jgi:hypothetical protein